MRVISNFGGHPRAVISVQSFAPTTQRKRDSESTTPFKLFVLLPHNLDLTPIEQVFPSLHPAQ
jgi:hypothetical protein